MKLNKLPVAEIAALKEQRTKLAAARDGIVKGNQALATLEKQQADLTAEIVNLESASPGDKSAVQSLGEKRTELELVTRRLSELPVADVEGEAGLRSLTMETARMMEKALTPTEDEYIAEIAALLKRFCVNETHAFYLARQTSAAASLAGRVHARFGTYGRPAQQAKLALAALDEVLSGELNWSFIPDL